jgi:hypothetical protein
MPLLMFLMAEETLK